ncbi:Putative signal peptide protein [Minicystis rosea]|nr:Putative signal peptide protein [Minicystis rosea]
MRAWLRITGFVFLSACSGGALPEVRSIPPATMVAEGYAFPEGDWSGPKVVAPPLDLTASDGSGLKLVSLEARAVVEDPLAFTELHLTFDNPERRQREGTFTITLPEGAAISRFAMKNDDGWQEGEVVEKKAARAAYEDFLHRKQDPALLEQAAGNQFSARVFPIPAQGRKEIVVSYSQEIESGRSWSLPLRGLPELGQLEVSVSSQAEPIARMSQSNVTPAADFTLDPKLVGRSAGLRHGNLVLARVRPLPDADPDPLGATLLLVDTSASRALGFEEETRLVDALVRRIASTAGAQTKVVVACFDQTVDPIFEGEAGTWGDGDARKMRTRQAFGASNLGRALGWAEEHAGDGYKRVVLVGDGVATAGETAAGAIGARAAKLASKGVERLDVIAVGGIRDEATLKKIATAGLPRDGVVADASLGIEAITARLSLRTHSGIPVQVEGARWSFPTRLDGVQAGDEVLVYADVPEGTPVRVRVGDRTGPALDLAPVARPLLERSVARAKIASLLATESAAPQPEVVREVIALSTRHRVLSPYTSLLVLETEQDYARFSLDRRALADILTVSGGKLAVMDRRPANGKTDHAKPISRVAQERRVEQKESGRTLPSAPPAHGEERFSVRPAGPPRAAPAPSRNLDTSDPPSARGNMWGDNVGDSFGAGGLGLTGSGEGGGGRGEGIGLGRVGTLGHGAGSGAARGHGGIAGDVSHSASVRSGTLTIPTPRPAQGYGRPATPPASVSAGATTVSGRIPPEVIQRVVRERMSAIRRCYETGLAQSPGLAGRAGVRFMIGPSGTVATISLDSSLDASTNSCITAEFRKMRFPAPEGGSITVSYPLLFSPADSSSPAPERHVEMPPTPVPPAREAPRDSRVDPYTGRFKTVMDVLARGGAQAAVEGAFAWHREAPGDVMALVALGEALEAAQAPASAARAYGSIIDLFPGRADLRRFAGERLERLAGGAALDMAIDSFEKAEEQRPDHPASHRLLAFARLRRGDHAGAFEAAERGLKQAYPANRFRGVNEILREDLGLIAAAWIKADPKRQDEITSRLVNAGGTLESEPSLRFVLGWETDANDVDFHIEDAEGGHAYYNQPMLPSGGRLYADVTTGYGPECFTIRLPKERRSAEYRLSAHYYSRGPMGYGMGKLEILDHDGKGGITFEERPFVVMADRAFVDLGRVSR